MLSAADATLVERDPNVPGLAVLLDPDAFGQTLASLYPGSDVRAAQPRYVRYKPGTSCLVGYRVDTGAGPLDLYARAHNPRIDDKIDKAGQRRSIASPLGAGIKVDNRLAVVIFPFPNDHELRGLRALAEDEPRRDMFQRLLPDHEPLWDAQLDSLRYKPERRYVARLHQYGNGGAVLKFYTRDDFELCKDNVDRFETDGPLRIPRRLGRSKRYGVTAVEWVDGRPLRQALSQSQLSGADYRLVGRALACLHAQKPSLEAAWTAEHYARLLAEAAVTVAEIAPDLEDRARGLAQRIGEKFTSRHWRARRSLHGDLSTEQLLLQDGAVAIVDFDRASHGDPRIDLGTFNARLAYDVVRGSVTDEQAGACFEAVMDEYREASAKDVTRKLERFTAASLLRIAVEPFRYRLENWPEKIETLIARAEKLANTGQGKQVRA